MKITDLKIDGFGVWSGLQLSDLADDIIVFYGPNEAGKTTLLQFIRTVLYGFSTERRGRYLPPVYGGAAGGALSVASAKGRYDIKRRMPRYDGLANGKDGAKDSEASSAKGADSSLGEVTILSKRGQRQGRSVLNALLASVDEATFNNVFAVGLREIQELGTLDDTEAADQLYKLTSGLDRVSLVDVMRKLEADRIDLLAPDDRPSKIADLLEKRRKLQVEIDELAGVGRHYAQLAGQHAALTEEAAQLANNAHRLEHECRVVETALSVREPWMRRKEVNDRLTELGELTDLPEDIVERLDSFNEQIERHRQSYSSLKTRRAQLRQEAAALPIHRSLVRNASRIGALSEHGPWITSLQRQIDKLAGEISAREADLNTQWKKIGLPDDLKIEKLPELSDRATTALQNPAKAHRDEQARLRKARDERKQTREEIETLSGELKQTLSAYGDKSLKAALEQAGETVASLRKRQQIQRRLDQLRAHQAELSNEGADLLDQQMLPLHLLAILGAVFILGIVLILSGMFGGYYFGITGAMGWLFALLGIGGTIAALATKHRLQQDASDQLHAARQQLATLNEQLDEALAERDALEQSLSIGSDDIDERLRRAESDLRKLEDLLPVEARRQAAIQSYKALGNKAKKATGMMKFAGAKWKSALRSAGLPEEMTPQQVRDMTDRCQRVTELGAAIESLKEEKGEREEELRLLCERIEKMWEAVNLQPASDDLRDQIRQLTSTLAQQQQMVDRRRELSKQFHSLRREQTNHGKALQELLRQRRQLMADAKMEDEEQLRQSLANQIEGRELLEERERLDRQIADAIHERVAEEELGAALHGREVVRLERTWEHSQKRLSEEESRLAQIHERRGEIAHELKTLADDRRLAKLKMELGGVERQIVESMDRWRTFAVTSLLLESIRKTYETQRQPQTLADASRFLDELTEGDYNRIWTPFGENALRVDDREGRSLSVDLLSSGTREAVFLSLRLALASAYARRGAVLPLVLDDVLVNFDSHRALAAARVFRDFAAEGGQMLIFTCHEHIMEIFEEVGVQARELPTHAGRTSRLTRRPRRRIEPVIEEIDEEEVDEAPEPAAREPEPEPEPVNVDEALVDYELQEPVEVNARQPLFIVEPDEEDPEEENFDEEEPVPEEEEVEEVEEDAEEEVDEDADDEDVDDEDVFDEDVDTEVEEQVEEDVDEEIEEPQPAMTLSMHEGSEADADVSPWDGLQAWWQESLPKAKTNGDIDRPRPRRSK